MELPEEGMMRVLVSCAYATKDMRRSWQAYLADIKSMLRCIVTVVFRLLTALRPSLYISKMAQVAVMEVAAAANADVNILSAVATTLI